MGQELGVEPGVDLELELDLEQATADPIPATALLGCVSLEAEVPEVLFDGMREFIRAHPQWDQYRLITAALASFLFQNGSREACVAQHYLNGLFMREA